VKHVASLDLLRGLAAFAVAIPHYLILNSPEHSTAKVISVLSVEIFFVLSGFVLAPQIIACARYGAWLNLKIFLIRRWMRTVPAYLVALLAISAISGQLFTSDFFRYAIYAQNLVDQANHTDYFPVAWSLSVEEWFYVTFPLFVFLAAYLLGRVDKRLLWGTALLFIGAIIIGRLVAGSHENWDEDVRRVVVFRVDAIAFGFCLYLFVELGRQPLFSGFSRKTLLSATLFVASVVIGLAVTHGAVIGNNPIAQQLFPFAAALFGMTTIAMFSKFRELTEGHDAIRQVCLYLGRISYSIYLFHLLLILLLEPALRSYPLPLQLTVFIACMVLFSSIFYLYFERPILAARPQFRLDGSARETPALEAPPLKAA
jgi:peptidoglycan/LPS O-acetylase OafA/YrhL